MQRPGWSRLTKAAASALLVLHLHCMSLAGGPIGRKIDHERGAPAGLLTGLAGDTALSIYAGIKLGIIYGAAYAGLTLFSLPFILAINNPHEHGEWLDFPVFRADQNGERLRDLLRDKRNVVVAVHMESPAAGGTADEIRDIRFSFEPWHSTYRFHPYDSFVRTPRPALLRPEQALSLNERIPTDTVILHLRVLRLDDSCGVEEFKADPAGGGVSLGTAGYREGRIEAVVSLIDPSRKIVFSPADFHFRLEKREHSPLGDNTCPGDRQRSRKMAGDELESAVRKHVLPVFWSTKFRIMRDDDDPAVWDLLNNGADTMYQDYPRVRIGNAYGYWIKAYEISGGRSEGAAANLAFYFLSRGYFKEARRFFAEARDLNGKHRDYWEKHITRIDNVGKEWLK